MKHAISGLCLLVLAACQSGGDRFPPRHAADETGYAVTSSSEILIVYIAASNCPPCWIYKASDHPVWIRSAEYKHVIFRELNFPQFQRTDEDRYWPAELRWVREKTYAQRGAPRWIVAVDGRIVSNRRSWNGQTYPLIQRLVARKLHG